MPELTNINVNNSIQLMPHETTLISVKTKVYITREDCGITEWNRHYCICPEIRKRA
jgi:hypothetical protein